MKSLKQTIMDMDGISSKEADKQIADAKAAILEYLEYGDMESAHDVCEEFFGLEPDYLLDLFM